MRRSKIKAKAQWSEYRWRSPETQYQPARLLPG